MTAEQVKTGLARARTGLAVGAVLLLALAVRAPGFFWGCSDGVPQTNKRYTPDVVYRPSTNEAVFARHFTTFHPDEPNHAAWASDILNRRVKPDAFYPQGLAFQISVPGRLLRDWNDGDALLWIGRALSILYGVMTVLLVFAIVRQVTGNRAAALAAALMMSLAGLHVTQSHYATAESANTFYLYATIYAAWRAVRGSSWRWCAAAAVLAGLHLSIKLQGVALIPVVGALILSRARPGLWVACLLLVPAAFYAGSGGAYGWTQLLATQRNLVGDNLNVIPGRNPLLNPLVYAVQLVPAAGLLSFAAAAAGLAALARAARRRGLKRTLRSRPALLIGAPLAVLALLLGALDIPFPRQITPLLPGFIILGALGFAVAGWTEKWRGRRVGVVLALYLVYQLAYVANTEYYYLRDPRLAAGRWIRENVPAGTPIASPPWDFGLLPTLGDRHPIRPFFAGPVVVLHQTMYFRYFRNECNPFTMFHDPRAVYQYNPGAQKVLYGVVSGEVPFALIKSFRVRYYTPELWAYRRLWGSFHRFIGDTLVFGHDEWRRRAMPRMPREAAANPFF